MALRLRAHRGHVRAGGDRPHLVGQQLAGDVLPAHGGDARRPPAALGPAHQLVRARRHGRHLRLQLDLVAQGLPERVVPGRPATAGRERHDRLRAPALGELQRDVAAERVAGDPREPEPLRIHHPLHAVGQPPAVQLVERRPAGVAGQCGSEHVERALERGQHQVPRPPAVGEPVQQHERRARAAAMERREDVTARAGTARRSRRTPRPWPPGRSARPRRGRTRARRRRRSR